MKTKRSPLSIRRHLQVTLLTCKSDVIHHNSLNSCRHKSVFDVICKSLSLHARATLVITTHSTAVGISFFPDRSRECIIAYILDLFYLIFLTRKFIKFQQNCYHTTLRHQFKTWLLQLEYTNCYHTTLRYQFKTWLLQLEYTNCYHTTLRYQFKTWLLQLEYTNCYHTTLRYQFKTWLLQLEYT